MKTLSTIVLLLCSQVIYAQPMDKAEVLRQCGEDSDLAYWAARNGINFPKLVENCLNPSNQIDQANAWVILVNFIDTCGADGAAGDAFSMVGPGLASLVESERLEWIMTKIPRDQWKSLPFDPVARFGYSKMSDEEKAKFQANHPYLDEMIKDTLLRRNDYEAWKVQRDKRKALIDAALKK